MPASSRSPSVEGRKENAIVFDPKTETVSTSKMKDIGMSLSSPHDGLSTDEICASGPMEIQTAGAKMESSRRDIDCF